jgi:4-hydroxy-tetrahydrodipicolinate synthase
MSGDDNLTYDMMKMGGKGVISVASNIIPERMQKFCETMSNGDWITAKKEHDSLLEFFKTLFVETNPGPVKYMAYLLDIMSMEVRSPLVTLEPENRKKVKQCLVSMGLITQAQADKKQ